MADETHLLDLVVRWEEARQAGHSPPAEELCRDCPELLPALRERLAARQATDAVLTAEETGQEAESASAGRALTMPDTAGRADGLSIPEIPGYVIRRELGRGGMGVVYQARQTALKRPVALKMLLAGPYAAASERARFEAEVEAIARLQHPNLVQVFEVGEHDGRAFYSMEYLEGGNLEEKIGTRPQPARQAAALVGILARAIHAAHERGIVHRDLKPANVLLTADGAPKISDFGLAKRLDVNSDLTLTLQVLGTPCYMAPEQAAGRSKQVGPATDVYALGAILYRMLTGRPPFQGVSPMDVLNQTVEEEPVSPRRLERTVPADLETICLKCLRQQPAQRYSSAAALADDVRRFLAHEPIMARPIGPWGRLLKWARRRPAAAGLVVLSGLAILAVLTTTVWFNQRLSAELQKTRLARRDALAAQRQLETALAGEVAAALDADLRQLEMVPQSVAALLARRVNWQDEDLEAWTRALVDKDKRVFGLCLAFEPQQFVGTRPHEDYCLYVHELAGGLRSKQLLPPDYPPPGYRERDWYQRPRQNKGPWWSEPYKRQGADDTPMVTYSVPFYRDGKFAGVVAADLSIEYFRDLRHRLHEQFLGENSYSFILSPNGTFVYHPNPKYAFPAAMSSLDRIDTAPDFRALVERMRQHATGWETATDFETGRPATFCFARIPATGGHFVIVHPAPPSGSAMVTD